jgi:hypothetical protein
LIEGRINPEKLGIKQDTVYLSIEITDAKEKIEMLWLIVTDDNQLVYYRYSKYYRLIRSADAMTNSSG